MTNLKIDRMPWLFIGHGSPINTLERNGFTETWREIGEALPAPSRFARHLSTLVFWGDCRYRHAAPANDP